jgi:hypothetical protein
MKLRILKTCFAILAPGSLAAETLVVFSGESIQAKIDEATDGDIIAIFGGSYFPDLTINKRVRLVEVQGQEVKLIGAVTFDGVENCPPFVGFEMGDVKGMTVTNCSGLTISDLVAPSYTQNGGSVSLSEVSIAGNATQNSGSLDLSGVTIGGSFSTGSDAVKTVAYRVTVTGDCNWASNRSWFGYGKARSFNFTGSDAKVVFVGGEIDRLGAEADGMLLQGTNNTITITNSKITGTNTYRYNRIANIEIAGSGHNVKILNNYLHKTGSSSRDEHSNIVSNVANLTVANNIVSNTDDGMVYAPAGAVVTNNHSENSRNYGVLGGVVAQTTTAGDPLFVDGNVYELGEGSPCIDAGTEDARYNDRDGTRNNIGPSGGSWYDPEGWTTEKPVVISFDLLPDQVLEGRDTKVTVDEVRAVSSPAQN